MQEWYAGLDGLGKAFAVLGGLGGAVFVTQFVLMLIGGDGAESVEGESASGALLSGHASSDVDFQFLSVQGISVFFMIFGIVGLLLLQEDFAAYWALLGGIVAGGGAMYLVARLFAFFRSLQSSGTLNLNNAVGQEGRVYLTIPQGGVGQVEIAIQGQQRICDAITEGGASIPTDSRVRVVSVVNSRFIVEAITADKAPE
ncbi:MAG: hypothetical protein GX146_02935 [Myxococcales bacterium]|jgi:hypothetical protein|nr:hypothetical protein [Myxococcales bacterium]